MTVAITGFTAFEGVMHNPSEALLYTLPDRILGHNLHTEVLPVDAERVGGALERIYALDPIALIHCGVATERSGLSLEALALNVLHFPERPDNAGRRIEGQPVVDDAPLAVRTRLPIQGILEGWRQAGLPHSLSHHAGTYICNQVMFLSLYRLPTTVPTGFVHVPPESELSIARMAEGLEIAVRQTLTPMS